MKNEKLPKRRNRKNSLWKFLYRLLESPNQENDNLLQWVDRKNYIFRVVQTAELAHRWGQEKNKVNMNYDKLSRALRQYKHGEVQKIPGQKLMFKFGHVVMKDDYKTS
ncbi:ETS-related transcription factor Elf-5-like [Xenia sp. Carnegie-2017]|uniref:ETS-related transcription factor Elf-5-like n=1 Tax=Xenia sp. Carnegie-2017 TaxID=2897299 RepID=UPI001F03D7F6|nr:ETS-related transcription factor Elf-5-like [Xenia sp. Carnegie-2017]